MITVLRTWGSRKQQKVAKRSKIELKKEKKRQEKEAKMGADKSNGGLNNYITESI